MELWHQICLKEKDIGESFLEDQGMSYTLDGSGYVIQCPDAHPACKRLVKLAEQNFRLVALYARFDESDRENANWLRMAPGYLQGYPKPEGGFGYIEHTYDTTNYCKKCGAGHVQKGPFRIKGEPSWKRKDIFQLNWVFDEHFTNLETWEKIFKPFGVGKREVVHHGKGHVLETVVQLDIPIVSSAPMVMGDFEVAQVCEECGCKKYTVTITRYYPPFSDARKLQGLHLFRSQEWFGWGHQAERLTVVSNELYRAMRDARLRGVSWVPIENR